MLSQFRFNALWLAMFCYFNLLFVMVKESHNRSGVAQGVPGGLGSQIS